jgi:hypothetical protein
MDVLVVGLEHLEAAQQPRLRPSEDREELVVLDRVVALEMAEERLQPRPEPGAVLGRRQPSLAEIGGALGERHRRAAEAVVDAKPEAGEFAEVGVPLPDSAGIALDEELEVVGPAGALVEVEGSWRGRELVGGRVAPI